MDTSISILILQLIVTLSKVGYAQSSRHVGHETADEFSNEWVVKIEGGPRVAQSLADELGYEFLGEVRYSNLYLLYILYFLVIYLYLLYYCTVFE